MRISMHPGQYTVINSPDDVVTRAVADLEYREQVLNLLSRLEECLCNLVIS